jgi:carnitine-CoA ligase
LTCNAFAGTVIFFYVVCPMFHVTGTLGGVFAALIAGSTAHIGKPFSASSFFADVDEAGATHTVLVSTMVEFLLRQPPSDEDAAHCLNAVYTVPLHPDHEEFAKRFAVRMTTSYGSTELGCVLVNEDNPDPARDVGLRIRRGFEVRLVDEFDIEVPEGSPGHAIFRSDKPWLLGVQYQGNHEATVGAWRNGWFHSGDLLTKDRDGYFRYVDRQRDAIRRRGENISSMEVETQVLRHEDVVECAAVGVASEYTEQEVKVFVVRRTGSTLTPEHLSEFLVDFLPRYSLPRFIEFIDELPRTATEKVRKETLRAMSNDKSWDREASDISLPR